MSDLDYVYAVARIRVKEKSLLSDSDIAQMTGMKDEKAVIAYLEEKGWGDQNSGSDPDRILAAEEAKTDLLMKELKIAPEDFEVLTYPELYHNLKAGIKEIFTAEDNCEAFYPLEKYGRDEMLQILKDREYKLLPEHMQKAAERAYEVMVKTRDGQMCDVIVDRACLDAQEAFAAQTKNQLLRDYIQSTVAVTDIKIAVRAQKTGKNRLFLKEALSPTELINIRLLTAAATESWEALLAFLETHGFKEGAEALKESGSAFERWCDNRLIETIRPQKANPFSLGPVIAFYLARKNEIKTARIILTAKANGFSEEATRERVREMYV
jgi:V/A-type H+-transporting ATPase subunit C